MFFTSLLLDALKGGAADLKNNFYLYLHDEYCNVSRYLDGKQNFLHSVETKYLV